MGQFLTAVFRLEPSRRKAAALERVRAAAEEVFWQTLAGLQARADGIVAIADAAERRAAVRILQADIARLSMTAAVKADLPESVAQGIGRDLSGSIGSNIELRVKGHAAEWPAPVSPEEADPTIALELFQTATTRDDENAARDALSKAARLPGPRPLTIARSRDATLLRRSSVGGLVVALNVLRAADARSRPVLITSGINASTGEITKPERTKTKLLVPVSCSKWHEQKFLSGGATLKSSLILRRGEQWFMCAQFEMAEARRPVMTGARLGVDRGIINPIAVAVVDKEGAVVATPAPAGTEIGQLIRTAEQKRRTEQKRRGISARKHARQIDHHLHHLANRIVADAKAFGAQVVTEQLGGFKAVIRTKRPKGARRSGWQKSLKAVQLGKLETILAYKLRLAGLPDAREVGAHWTSATCPSCSHRDPKSRETQERFACTGCGFVAHADTVGGVNIARRSVALQRHEKGGDFAALERDVVVRLRSRADCGLGPLEAGLVAVSGFVAVRAAAVPAYDPSLLGLTETAGQEATLSGQTASDRRVAEPPAAFSQEATRALVVATREVLGERNKETATALGGGCGNP